MYSMSIRTAPTMYVYAAMFTAVCKAVVVQYVVCILCVPAVLHVLCIVIVCFSSPMIIT